MMCPDCKSNDITCVDQYLERYFSFEDETIYLWMCNSCYYDWEQKWVRKENPDV